MDIVEVIALSQSPSVSMTCSDPCSTGRGLQGRGKARRSNGEQLFRDTNDC
jgi:hypothetical protein